MTQRIDTSAAVRGAAVRAAEADSMDRLSAGLAQLQQEHAGCRLVAYGDLAAQLVLRAEPARARPQEALDALCAEARDGFALLDALNAGKAEVSEPVISLVPGEAHLFMRRADEGSEGEAVLVAGPDLASVQAMTPAVEALLHPAQASVAERPEEQTQ